MSIQKNTPQFLRHSGLSFTTIVNQTMDLIIDPASLGIYCYLASKPDNWQINNAELQSRFNKGFDFIKGRLADLKNIGLIRKVAIRDEATGKILRWEIELINYQEGNNKSSGLSRGGKNHLVGKPPGGKTDPNNNIYIKIKDNIKPIVDSDESTENDYNVNDESQIPKKSDYSNNHQEYNKKGPETLDGKVSSEKSDYFEKQSNHKTDCKNKSRSTNKSYTEDDLFMLFYSQYPNKQKPTSAYQAFLKLKPTPEFVSMIVEDVKRRLENNWKNRHKSKIPHPSTYLNTKEWEGEIFPPDNVTKFPNKPPRYTMSELMDGVL